MSLGIKITDGIHWIGVNDFETHLFEALWPLPKGVSYNAYMIVDEKVVLIDTVKGPYFSTYLDKLKSLLPVGKTVDYLVVNHMEPDHSGSIKVLREAFPEVKIIGNQKTADMLGAFYGLTDNLVVVRDGEELSLGEKRLVFYMTPMVHWPETMMTYEKSTGVIFSGDAFGGFGALNGGIFDDEVDVDYYEDEVLRYFSNIVGRYSAMVQKAFEKLKGVDIKIICATHGPVWRNDPAHIINLYDRWSKQQTEEGVVLVYGSMYGNTQKMMEAVAAGLVKGGVEKIRVHNISTSHLSFIIRDIWRFKGLVLGSCTYNMELFPPMKQLVNAIENRMMVNRKIGIFGSYTWSGGALKELQEFAGKSKCERVGPVIEAKSSPTAEDIDRCVELGMNMAKAVKS
ncbi:MAG TPA: FprA family A-type flavoprotein [Mesotoga infera]|jgi:flavorubredoxin|uniref:Flavodoxin/nitric oxide synthase n=1 Tax=Mesotoga infera TaxID=1236046 RepID=A0A7Z7LEA9_9BACT|nr:FprA family A-type flavoprotein [Mesotoga infera]MBP8660739.1 FprA family A-type flavoprotein [Mesotoga sp.]NLI06537.1 FprA family A-type flavoprotein [Thermotogaceae bacterium]SSC12388.1 Flavodoxin/nitric oxide synthase [Mesotoga infera]HNR79087.1 FprA family A-type flavoprotein [Mesotoga infera]HNS67337.1 FprA family A-type flavoprotein [Mesotoga infera]